MIKTILWDIDATVLDFIASEKQSILSCFEKFHLGECTDEMLADYSAINIKHWQMLERGEEGKQAVLINRFVEFFDKYGINKISPEQMCSEYENGLPNTIVFLENSFDIIKSLKGKYRQYAVTNGALSVQTAKLQKSGLSEVLDGAFISDEIGFEKPNARFFDWVLSAIEPCDKNEIIIIGDSLTSDMMGGNNAGIKCCWYNPSGKENNIGVRIDYEINSLLEVFDIL